MHPVDMVEDFELEDQRRQTWRLRNQQGRPVLLVFHRHLV